MKRQRMGLVGLFMRTITLPILNLILALVLAATGFGAQQPPSEYQLKAAFLFNFAKFVEWPAGAFAETNSPLVIGVLGDSPFGGDLERTVQGKTISGRRLEIREFRSPAEARNSHILFVCNSENKRLPEVLEALRGSSVLTVSEWPQFTAQGGMINFVLDNNKIRFQINDRAAQTAGLKISSKLLSLAVPPAR